MNVGVEHAVRGPFAETGPFSRSRGPRGVDCILLLDPRMPLTLRRSLAALALAASLVPSPAFAGDPPPPHVRAESPLREIVDEAARRSPSVRALIDRLDAADVTVYVRMRAFAGVGLDGRIGLLSTAGGGHRYLVIELACGRSDVTLMATLGHELQHAVEIAEEPSAVDARSLAAFYARVGARTSDTGPVQTFDTDAARAAGAQVRRELLIPEARPSNGT